MAEPLFKDERTQQSEVLSARLNRLESDFPKDVKLLEDGIINVASLAGMQNTRLLLNALMDRVEARGDIPL